LLFAGLAAALAHDFQAGSIGIDQALLEAAEAGGPGTHLASLRIVNDGPADKLVSVSCARAQAVEIRRAVPTDAGTSIRTQAWLGISAKSRVELTRDGYYLAFVGLKGGLSAGDRIAATLRFSSGTVVPVEFVVGEPPTDGQAGER